MIQQFKMAYALHNWVKILAWSGLVSITILLLAISGGFPPQAWLLLERAVPQMRRLLSARGLSALASFMGVSLLSLTWAILWAMLLWISITLLRGGKQKRRAPAKSNWQRKSADNVRNHGYAEAQVTLANAAFASAAAPVTRPRVESTSPPAMRQFVPTLTTSEYETAANSGQRAAPTASADVGIGWDPGITRRHKPNEDAVLVERSISTFQGRLVPLALYVVADGMGGHASGRVASHLAAHSMMRSVLATIQQGEELSETFLMDTLTDCAHQANLAVYRYHEEHGTDLGTTITAALLVESSAYIVNVGDSRTYIYRQVGGLAQITRDHSLVARLLAVGAISAEEVYTHPDRNKIYRGLGEKDSVQIDWFIEPVRPGDYLLLCSDGLWEMVRDHEIEKILKRCLPDVSQASDALVKAALHRGGSDNVSVIVARV